MEITKACDKEVERISRMIRTAITDRRLTQKKVAEKMRVSQSTISRIINDPGSAKYSDVRWLCSFLGIEN